MKKEQLKELGVPDEAIEKVLAINNEELTAAQAETTAKTQELATANTKIKELSDTVKKFDGVDVAALNKQIADLTAKYDKDIAQARLDRAVDIALISNKARNTKAARSLLELDKIKLEDGKVVGLDEQLKALKKSDGYLFDEEPAADKGQGEGKAEREGQTAPPPSEPPRFTSPIANGTTKGEDNPFSFSFNNYVRQPEQK